MRPIAYSGVVLIGTGRVACGCLESILDFTDRVTAVEPEQHAFSLVRPVCQRRGVDYLLATDKQELNQFFLTVHEPTLVISAHNIYLFPPKVIENENLQVVNFHNSLLPRHAGRNAPTWAIFDMDERAGITWHQVSQGIDQGAILVQRSIPIGPKMIALELTKRCADLGLAAFREILPQLLHNQCEAKPQACEPEASMHRSTEVPNDGWLDLGWLGLKVSAFLRSMDYGKLQILPPARVRLLGREYTVTHYDLDLSCTTPERDGREVLFRGNELVMRDETLAVRVQLD